MTFHQQLLADLVEFAPDAMLIVDASGQILYANQRVTHVFGYEREDIVNRSVDLLLPDRLRTRHAHHRRNFAQDPRTRPMGAGFELLGRRMDGSEFPLEISLSPLRDGLAAAAIRDVTDRKRVEQELIHAREAADQAREEADRANLSKSRFLATASHDLRQPLQALSMLHGTLCRVDMHPNGREVLAQQGLAIDAMKRLLSALLDISKLESGAVNPQPSQFPVRQLFELLSTEFSTAARSKGLALVVEQTDLSTCTDQSLLEQLLRNLISNAIKYTRAGTVTLRATPLGSGMQIEICDTGVGIPADQQAYIFDEFFQVGVARNTTREGYGLGLAIVQRIAKLLGLRIHVQSEVGKGSTFTLQLPRAEAVKSDCPVDTPASGNHLTRHAQSGKILVTEDEPSVLRATRLLLELEGYQVIPASSREEALLRGREHPDIDLLVSDYHLKEDQTGLNVISGVREQLARNIPAILVTGDTSSAMRKLPADRQLRLASKPVDAEELLTLIGELLNTHRAT
ncbi:hybrid sensor histidine kinase/response regulator [Peristeroidobacter soli]|uniref:hybrid sensor histidine kinase/response regulator n=1 Tax=Peristeroidobacter soli TaxID=2497877 RepID=UPI00101E0679|nr:ATP-binding protein [Peristeroidobacter soli]